MQLIISYFFQKYTVKIIKVISKRDFSYYKLNYPENRFNFEINFCKNAFLYNIKSNNNNLLTSKFN